MMENRQQQQQQVASVCKVKVQHLSTKRGRGLVATEQIQSGEIIYAEAEPLAAAEHEYSRLCGLTCSNCLCFVGSLKDTLRHILTSAKRVQALLSLEEVPDSFFESLGFGQDGAVPCGESGCDAVFCSLECRQHAREETFHRVVCVAAENRTCWKRFVAHARRHHDGLALAGQCVAQVLFEVVYRNQELQAAMALYKRFHSAPWESLAKKQGAPGLQGAPQGAPREAKAEQQGWEERESCSLRETGARESMHTPEGRRHLLQVSLHLLREALEPTAQKHQALTDVQQDELFGLEFFSRLVGTFSLVCLDVEFDHPLNSRLAKLLPKWRERLQQPSDKEEGGGHSQIAGSSSPPDEDAKETRMLIQLLDEVSALTCGNNGALDAQEKEKGETKGGPEGGPLLPFLGWGLFFFGSMTNHSCWPNAESDFPLPRPSLEVRALRPIQEGEEVVLSYIDETLPLHERQRLLKENYNFSCTCARCVVEATEALLLLMKVPACSDKAQLEELLSRRTGLSLEVVSELRAWRRSLEERHQARLT